MYTAQVLAVQFYVNIRLVLWVLVVLVLPWVLLGLPHLQHHQLQAVLCLQLVPIIITKHVRLICILN